MKYFFKNPILFSDKRRRKIFATTEIFFDSCSILDQAKFSTNLSYFFFKRRTYSSNFFTILKNRCLFSGYSRSVNSKLKLSRISLSRKLLNGTLPGFYRSI